MSLLPRYAGARARALAGSCGSTGGPGPSRSESPPAGRCAVAVAVGVPEAASAAFAGASGAGEWKVRPRAPATGPRAAAPACRCGRARPASGPCAHPDRGGEALLSINSNPRRHTSQPERTVGPTRLQPLHNRLGYLTGVSCFASPVLHCAALRLQCGPAPLGRSPAESRGLLSGISL